MREWEDSILASVQRGATTTEAMPTQSQWAGSSGSSAGWPLVHHTKPLTENDKNFRAPKNIRGGLRQHAPGASKGRGQVNQELPQSMAQQ